MTILQSVLTGTVQGITEFLPAGSTGHLAILQNIFRIQADDSLLADIMLRLGTLLAVLVVYYRDVGKMLAEAVSMIGDLFVNAGIWIKNRIHKSSLPYRNVVRGLSRRFCALLLISAVFSCALGFAGRYLYAAAAKTLLIPGICFWITAVLLMMIDTAPKGCKFPLQTNYADSLVIGLAHGLAAMPGLSRTGSAMAAGALCGMERRFALRYSFFLLGLTDLAVLLWEIPGVSWKSMTAEAAGVFLTGTACTCAAGFVGAKLMFYVVQQRKYRLFAIYCVFAGAVAVGGHFFL